MKEQLISFETAKLAKEKGFKWKTVEVYAETKAWDMVDHHNGNYYEFPYTPPRLKDYKYLDIKDTEICKAPTQSLLQKWLRDREENIIIVIPMRDFHRNYNGWYYEVFTQLTKKDKPVLMISSDENFDTYEEALEKGLQEALKLI